MTPYEQAKMYDNYLPFDERARWIITSNFAEIWIYDRNAAKPEPVQISLTDLPNKFHMLDFLVNKETKKVSQEIELSLKAGELVGMIHDRFEEQYNDPLAKRTQNSLNILCVRLVFCFYAEDAGLFGAKDAFSSYIAQYEPKDIRRALLDLFKVLDTPEDQREDLYLDDELAAFPYCNGGLFARENIEIPKITQGIKDALIESSSFDWSKISPTIFGAVFESTLNPETRRAGGMHYTSIENIHKVIDPLFLDDLKKELDEIKQITVVKTRDKKLQAFQDKLASLKFLDPAAGSGNFLTETYTCLRKLENEVVKLLTGGQMTFGEAINPIKVSISQFHGIEINDFAVTVARTALWIAESQMMRETEDIIHMQLDFLPLKTSAKILEENALQINWNTVVNKNELNYIMGNPPFVGYSYQSKTQKDDILSVYVDEKGKPYKTAGKIDYVSGWYFKASQMMNGTNIRTAFVSTNSITQGEQVAGVWEPLYKRYGIHIDFAYRTFIWDSEASLKAHVHCVIIGFSCYMQNRDKFIFEDGQKAAVSNISPYLFDSDIVFIKPRRSTLFDVPSLTNGGKPAEGGFLIINEEEGKEILENDPITSKYLRPYMMGVDFINRRTRYCLWLVNADPNDLKKSSFIKNRVAEVKKFRESSKKEATRKKALTPTLFQEVKECHERYVAIPVVSSQRRRYIPIDYLTPDIIAGNKLFFMENATLFHFGVLTSNVHMAWVRAIAGRLKSDYSYSNTVVYNNFPWPSSTEQQKTKIAETAQTILDIRARYPESTLADLYDPDFMPPELRKAHQQNDKAVMQAYGMPIKETDEAACVAWLMRLYQEKTSEQ